MTSSEERINYKVILPFAKGAVNKSIKQTPFQGAMVAMDDVASESDLSVGLLYHGHSVPERGVL